MTDVIRVRGLRVQCVLGTYSVERVTPQPIVVDLTLHARLRDAAQTGRISKTVDYDRLSHEVAALLRFRQYRLLETAVEECCAMLLGVHPLLTAVSVRIEKPEALAGRAQAASVEFFRQAADYPVCEEPAGELRRRVLLRTREAALELWNLKPGAVLVGPGSSRSAAIQWPLGGVLHQGTVRLPVTWPDASTVVAASDCGPVVNEGSEPARLFRCWRLE